MTKMLGNAIQAPLREKKLKTSALNVVNKHSVIDVEIYVDKYYAIIFKCAKVT